MPEIVLTDVDEVVVQGLQDRATRHGRTPADEAKAILVEVLRVNRATDRAQVDAQLIEPQDEWERRLFTAATDCGVALSHEAVGSEGLYE